MAEPASASPSRSWGLEWQHVHCLGTLPTPRFGHSTTVVGSNAWVFGGCSDTDGMPTNDLHVLRITGGDCVWEQIEVSSRDAAPLERWGHTMVQLSKTRLLLFGGFHSTKRRLNDLWIFDLVLLKWFPAYTPGVLNDEIGDEVEEEEGEYAGGIGVAEMRRALLVATKNASSVRPGALSTRPSPRGDHTGVRIGEYLFYFGGYGGVGFEQRDFNDLWGVDMGDLTWRELLPGGSTPVARSGHSAVVVGLNMYIFGGWSASGQFNDMHILSTEAMAWSQAAVDAPWWPGPRWAHAATAVDAIPSSRIFVFGGLSATGEVGQAPPIGTQSTRMRHRRQKAQGSYLNDLIVFETAGERVTVTEQEGGEKSSAGEGDESEEEPLPVLKGGRWRRPAVGGEIPVARSDATLNYDLRSAKLFLFGGFADRWFGDVYAMDVSSVAGPPYAVTSISPNVGPVTGRTFMEIRGTEFVSQPPVVVRFTARGRGKGMAGSIDVAGVYVNDVIVRCKTPNFEQFGGGPCDVRVSLRGDSFTSTMRTFNYFEVTNAKQCLAYGPGLVSGGSCALPTVFFIAAHDSFGERRTSGGDDWTVTVRTLQGVSLGVTVDDLEDGLYKCTYTAPREQTYEIDVEFDGTFDGEVGPIRGSKWTVEFAGAFDRTVNKIAGPLMVQSLLDEIEALKALAEVTADALDEVVEADDLKSLLRVKECLAATRTRADEVRWRVEVCKAIMAHLDPKKIGRVSRLNHQVSKRALTAAYRLWQDAQQKAPITSARLAPLVRMQAAEQKVALAEHEEVLAEYVKSERQRRMWSFACTADEALEEAEAVEEEQKEQWKVLAEKEHVAELLEFSELLDRSRALLTSVDEDIVNLRVLWGVVTDARDFMESCSEVPFTLVEVGELVAGTHSIQKQQTELAMTIQWSDAYLGLDDMLKAFDSTCPLLSDLGHPDFRQRHWQQLLVAMGVRDIGETAASLTMTPLDSSDVVTPSPAHDGGAGADAAEASNAAVVTLADIEKKPRAGAARRMSALGLDVLNTPEMGVKFLSPYEDDECLLGSVLGLPLAQSRELITSILDAASKEAKIERSVAELGERWSQLEAVPLLEAAGASGSGDNALGVADLLTHEVKDVLRNDRAELQVMTSSPSAVPFLADIKKWDDELANITVISVAISESQAMWRELYPLLAEQGEVRRELPAEAGKFASAANDLGRSLDFFIKSRMVLHGSKDLTNCKRTEKVKKRLVECHVAVRTLINAKRASFPRLYFAPQKELLMLLSTAGRPREALARFVPLVFPGMGPLIYDGDDDGVDSSKQLALAVAGRPMSRAQLLRDAPRAGGSGGAAEEELIISGWSSSNGGAERVAAEHPFKVEGTVIECLQKLEIAQKVTMRHQLQRSVERLPKQQLADWLVEEFPTAFEAGEAAMAFDPVKAKERTDRRKRVGARYADCVQAAAISMRIERCYEVREALLSAGRGRTDALTKFYDRTVKNVDSLAKLARTQRTPTDTMRLCASVIVETHFRDLAAWLAARRVATAGAFEWQSQLRFSTTVPVAPPQPPKPLQSGSDSNSDSGSDSDEEYAMHWAPIGKDVLIEACGVKYFYGYEYRGNAQRLVVTPIAERAMLAMLYALKSANGSAVTGPSASVNVETARELTTQMGRATFDLQCWDGLGWSAAELIENALLGLAQGTGWWGCIANVDVLPVGVLSLLANRVRAYWRDLAAAIALQASPPPAEKKASSRNDEIEVPQGVVLRDLGRGGGGLLVTMSDATIGAGSTSAMMRLPQTLRVMFRPVHTVAPAPGRVLERQLLGEGFSSESTASLAKRLEFFAVGARQIQAAADAAGRGGARRSFAVLAMDNLTFRRVLRIAGAVLRGAPETVKIEVSTDAAAAAKPQTVKGKKKRPKAATKQSKALAAIKKQERYVSPEQLARQADKISALIVGAVLREIWAPRLGNKEAIDRMTFEALVDELFPGHRTLTVQWNAAEALLGIAPLPLPSAEEAGGEGAVQVAAAKLEGVPEVETPAAPSTIAKSDRGENDENAAQSACLNRHLWAHDHFIGKIVQLARLMRHNQSVIVLGASGAGKSECWRTLAKMWGLQQHHVRSICSDALSPSELFGGYVGGNHSDGQWSHGLLHEVVTHLANASASVDGNLQDFARANAPKADQTVEMEKPVDMHSRWLVLDGAMTNEWIDALEPALSCNGFIAVPPASTKCALDAASAKLSVEVEPCVLSLVHCALSSSRVSLCLRAARSPSLTPFTRPLVHIATALDWLSLGTWQTR